MWYSYHAAWPCLFKQIHLRWKAARLGRSLSISQAVRLMQNGPTQCQKTGTQRGRQTRMDGSQVKWKGCTGKLPQNPSSYIYVLMVCFTAVVEIPGFWEPGRQKKRLVREGHVGS